MSAFMFLTLGAVFVSVALFTGLSVSYLSGPSTLARKRLRATTAGPRLDLLPEALSLSAQAPLGDWQAVAKYLPRSTKELVRLRAKLTRAGYRRPGAPIVYSLVEIVGPFVTGAVPLMLLSGPLAWLTAAGVALATFAAPSIVVGQRLAGRRKEIENGLPDALDLLVVCIEAGSGLDQAILKTAEEMTITYPALADELRLLTTEIRAGKGRIEAFKNLAQRTKIDDVRALVAMLVQTDRFGTSIGQALRTHAEVSRTKRRQRAEERAQQIGVKLVFPLVLLFFPAFFIVILGPAIIQFVHQLM